MPFSDRRRSEEAKYAMNAETAFLLRSRRNRLLGEWAARQKGLDGESAKSYVQDLVQLSMSSDAELMKRIRTGLSGIADDQAIADAVARCEVEAQRQINPA